MTENDIGRALRAYRLRFSVRVRTGFRSWLWNMKQPFYRLMRYIHSYAETCARDGSRCMRETLKAAVLWWLIVW